jgi:AcrR family transcriptional regulator
MVQNNLAAVKKGPAPRGRPRGFDTDAVLTAARETFWKFGFDGASMDQLAAATGLHKPSLYGAFGDKRQLYLQTLRHYRAEMGAAIAEALALPDLMEALDAFFEASIDLFAPQGERTCGCFMFSTAMTMAGEDAEVVAFIQDSLEALDKALVRRFETAMADGQLPADADAEALARIVGSGHSEVASRARAGYDRHELEALAALTIRIVKTVAGLPR